MNLSNQENRAIKVVLMNDGNRITYYGSCRVGVSLQSCQLKIYNLDNQLIRDADFDRLLILRQKYLLVVHHQVVDNFVIVFPTFCLCDELVDWITKLKNVAVTPGLENDFKEKLFLPLLSEIHLGHPQAEEMKKEVLIYVNGIPDANIRQEYTIMGFQILLIGVASVLQSETPQVVDDHDPGTVQMEEDSAVTPTTPVATTNAESLQPKQRVVSKSEAEMHAQQCLTSDHVDAESNVAEEDAVASPCSSIAVTEKRKRGRPRNENGGVAAKSKVIDKTPRASTRYSARLATSLPVTTSSTPSSTITIPTPTSKKGPGRPRKQ